MFKLRAYNTYNAAAVFETEKGLFFVEYPFTEDQVRKITTSQLDYLVSRLEFYPCDQDEADFAALVAFVNAKAEAARGQYETVSFTEDELIAGFEAYPEPMLASLLDDLRTRYLEAGQLAAARIAMDRYWRVRAIADNKVLRAKLIDMEQVYEMLLAPLHDIQQQPSASAFPSLNELFGDELLGQVLGFKSLAAA